MSLIIMIMKVWTVTSPQLVHINSCDLPMVLYTSGTELLYNRFLFVIP